MSLYFPLSALINGILSLCFAVYVLIINSKRRVNRVFSFLAFTVAFWNIPYFIWLISDNSFEALFWVRIVMMGPIFIPAAFFHFVVVLLKIEERKNKEVLFAYILSIFFALINLTPLYIQGVSRKLFFPYWPVPGVLFHFQIAVFVFFVFYAHVLMIRHYNLVTGNIRNQIKYVFMSSFVSFVGGMTNYFLWYDITVPPLGHSLVSVYIILSGYAIIKYRLLDIRIAIRRGILFTVTFMIIFSVPITLGLVWESNFYSIFGRRWWIGFFIAGGLLSYVSDMLYNYFREREDWRLHEEQRQNQAYLREASGDLIYIHDMKSLMDRLVNILNIGFRISQVLIYLKSDESNSFKRTASRGANADLTIPAEFKEDHPFLDVLENQGLSYFIEYLLNDDQKRDRVLSDIEMNLIKMKLEVIIPIIDKGKLSGFLILGEKKKRNVYTIDDIEVLLTFANQTALAINNIKAGEALIKSEEKYRDLMRSLPEIIFELDIEGNLTYINDRATELLGYSREELLGKNYMDLAVEREIALQRFSRILQENVYGGTEYKFKRKDGSTLTTSLYTRRVYHNNDVVGISGIAVDLTEVAEARKGLQESEEKFRTMIERSSEMITIIDNHGIVRYQSQSLKAVLGYKPEDVIDKDVLNFIHPDDIKRLRNVFIKMVKNPDLPLVVEYRLRHRDGSWRSLESTGKNMIHNKLIQGVIVNTRDISQRKDAEYMLQKREERYRSLYNNALVAMITIDSESEVVINTNDLGYQIFGYDKRDEFIGSIMSPCYTDKELHESLRHELKEKGSVYNREVEFQKRDDSIFWAAISQRLDKERELIETVIVDITKRKIAEQQAHDLAFYDQLTGLANRDTLLHLISTEFIKLSDRNAANVFALFCIGIDKMSHINTLYGRNIGDRLLVDLSKLLKSSFGDNALVARYEGDKFVILFSKIEPNEDFIRRTVRRASNIISTHQFVMNDDVITLTASIGVSIYPNDGDDPEEIVKNSEAAMYMAKDQGGNSFSLFDTRMYSDMLQRIQFEKELQDAIDHFQFVALYQPKVDRNSKIMGMESLIRWHSPSRGIVNPADFIPLSEKNGMIIDIGNYMLKLSLGQTKQLFEKGIPPLRVAVNLSPIQFSQPDIVRIVSDTIIDSGLDSAWLELEITETSIMKDETSSIRKLKELHDMGITIAIDDFGTGYSSLSKLIDYTIDTLKIDKSFVENLPLNKKSAALVASIIELAHNLDFNVVAEGVETREHVDFLMKQDCDYFQGNYFSRPVDFSEFKDMLINRQNLTKQ